VLNVAHAIRPGMTRPMLPRLTEGTAISLVSTTSSAAPGNPTTVTGAPGVAETVSANLAAGRPSGRLERRMAKSRFGSPQITCIGTTNASRQLDAQNLLLTRLLAYGDVEVGHNIRHPIRADDKTRPGV